MELTDEESLSPATPPIAPDVPVGLTSTDFFAGRDPALEAVLEILADGS